jgi:hypothetical protein
VIIPVVLAAELDVPDDPLAAPPVAPVAPPVPAVTSVAEPPLKWDPSVAMPQEVERPKATPTDKRLANPELFANVMGRSLP